MLIYFLVFVTIIVWVGIYSFYFRLQIREWLENRFGKDTPVPPPEEHPGQPLPFSYTRPPTDDPS